MPIAAANLRQRFLGDRAGPGVGWTEEIIGDWFAGGGGRRERTVLATKLYRGVLDEIFPAGYKPAPEHYAW